MSKRLKTTILVSSLVLVGFIVGLLVLSMVSNLSSVEVYDFRVYEMPNISENVNETTSNKTYEIYLNAQASKNVYSLSQDYPLTILTTYEFVSSNEEVASVVIANGEYQLIAQNVGVATFKVIKIDNDNEGNEIKRTENYQKFDCVVYRELSICDMFLTSPEKNLKEITVLTSASTSRFEIAFSSTNPEVAVVVSQDDHYFIQAISAGKTTITAYCAGNANIKDSFVVNVFDNRANNLIFVDKSGTPISSGTIYDDGTYFSFYYSLTSANGSESVNSNSVRINSISQTAINIQAWESSTSSAILSPFDAQNHAGGAGVVLDIENSRIMVKKSFVDGLSQDANNIPHALGRITLETFSNVGDNEIITGTYTLPINVYHEVQLNQVELEISNTPNFYDGYKYIYNSTHIPWKGISTGANNYTALEEGELEIVEINKVYTKKNIAQTFYIRAWKVYNNGDRELSGSVDAVSSGTVNNMFVQGPDGTYSIVYVLDGNLASSGTFYGSELGIDVLNSYNSVYTEKNGIHTFNYWDQRLRAKSEKTNDAGEIISL